MRAELGDLTKHDLSQHRRMFHVEHPPGPAAHRAELGDLTKHALSQHSRMFHVEHPPGPAAHEGGAG